MALFSLYLGLISEAYNSLYQHDDNKLRVFIILMQRRFSLSWAFILLQLGQPSKWIESV